MKELRLTSGYVAVVDDADFEFVAPFKWTAHIRRRKDGSIATVYAYRKTGGRSNPTIVWLHRSILGLTDEMLDVDHRNRNGLDCRRGNLRVCTRSQNSMNKPVAESSQSGFKGVTWHKRAGKWQVKLKVSGRQYYLGLFRSAEDGANAYNAAAVAHFGEFALLNVVSQHAR